MQQKTNPIINKVDALNADAWRKRVSDSAAALELSKEAARIAKSIKYTKGAAEALRTLGFSYIRISKHKEALQYLQEALTLFGILNDDFGKSDVFEYFGIVERSLGNYEN
jgi:tetratricopeptide (TPR) repeat protein